MKKQNETHWTEKEIAILWELFPYFSTDVVAGFIHRTQSAIRCKAAKLGVERFRPGHGLIKLIYEGEMCRQSTIDVSNGSFHFLDAMRKWYHEILPALRRGKKVSVEMEFELVPTKGFRSINSKKKKAA